MRVGLRVDVDTFRGTRTGVPELCRILDRHGIRATFFFSVGPDNMGRHLWRLLRPTFLWKMLRTRAASLYGWDILLRGVFWPGPRIGTRLADTIRATARAGHEIGLHAWDHHAWQSRIDRMDARAIRRELDQGFHALHDILGAPPACSAVPGWRCTDTVLLEKESLPFAFNSDCRGTRIFRPVIGARRLGQPQVPVTLPTYDEVIGRNGVTHDNYNDTLLRQLRPAELNVLTIHAEADGIVCRELFDSFIAQAKEIGALFCPLGQLVGDPESLPEDRVVPRTMPGREGWVAWQASDTGNIEH